MDIRKGDYKNVFEKQMETPKATVLITIHGKCDYNLKNSLLMTIFSQTMDMVYLEEVREKEGGTYGVSASGQLSRYPKDDEAHFQIYFDTDPAKRDKMVEIIVGELKKVAEEGPRAEHFNKVKEFLQKKHAEQVKENGYWLGALNSYYWYKTDTNTDYEKVLESITADDIKHFAKALLEQGNCIEVSMTCNEKK